MPDRLDIPLHPSGWSVASVTDHILLGSGYLLDPGGNVIIYRGNLTPQAVSKESKGKRPELFKYRAISRWLPRIRMRMDRATWVCRPNAVNYFHWLIETLPRLYCLNRIGWREPIVIGDQLMQKEWVRLTLPLFPELQFVVVPYRKEVRVKTVFLIDESGETAWEDKDKQHLRNAGILKELREFLLLSLKVAPQGARSRRIHISRQQDANRKIANIEAIRPVLDKFGFEEVTLQDLSLAAQFALLAETQVAFAPHGAGMANALFMPEGGSVIEVKHIQKFLQDSVFPGLSHTLGLSHHVLESARAGGRNDDFVVDPAALEAKLTEILGVHR